MHGTVANELRDPPSKVGRRSAARLRLSIPAKLLTIYETRPCVLLDLSRAGARIGLEAPLEEGDAGFLRFVGMDVFVCVVRANNGMNGLEFEHPLTNDQVLAVREYSETFEIDERRSLLNEVRAWVTGGH